MKTNLKTALLPLALSMLMTGCAGYGPWARQVSAFSTNAAPALGQATTAYTSANAIHTLQEESVRADQYAQKGYRPGELTTFMSANDIDARGAAISVIENYASLVGDLALGKRLQNETAKTKALAQSMSAAKTSTSTSASKTTSKALTSQEMGYALQGLDLAIKPIVEGKVHKNLPPIMAKADPSIQQVCLLLEDDMEDLRSQEKADYLVLLMEQNQFIQKNDSKLDAVEKRTEVLKLYQIEQAAADADASLVNAESALKQLAKAHHDLVTGGSK